VYFDEHFRHDDDDTDQGEAKTIANMSNTEFALISLS
jgi:hypothetical protein